MAPIARLDQRLVRELAFDLRQNRRALVRGQRRKLCVFTDSANSIV